MCDRLHLSLCGAYGWARAQSAVSRHGKNGFTYTVILVNELNPNSTVLHHECICFLDCIFTSGRLIPKRVLNLLSEDRVNTEARTQSAVRRHSENIYGHITEWAQKATIGLYNISRRVLCCTFSFWGLRPKGVLSLPSEYMVRTYTVTDGYYTKCTQAHRRRELIYSKNATSNSAVLYHQSISGLTRYTHIYIYIYMYI